MRGDRPEITRLLRLWSEGDETALTEVMAAAYEELRRLGGRVMAAERPGHTLQPTAIVHEAFLQLLEQRRLRFQDREHFFAVMALLMRRALKRYAERKRAAKRGGGLSDLPLEGMLESRVLADSPSDDLADLADALAELARLDPRQGRIVGLRFFGGLTTEEIARELGVAPITVKREWRLARAWLRREVLGEARVTSP